MSQVIVDVMISKAARSKPHQLSFLFFKPPARDMQMPLLPYASPSERASHN